MAAVLELRGVSKRFGRAEVLRSVSLAIEAGEVHALAGENGAGKSTLVKIVSGAHADFEGDLLLAGASVRFADPLAARRAGVATIHQELSLVGSMTVADNLALGRLQGGALARFDRAAARRDAARTLEAIGLDASPDALVESLPVGVQQRIEIAKALAEDAKVFLFDEPTSALNDAEAERLFVEIEALAARGKAILFVSHRTADLDRIARRITVLRDGVVALAAPWSEVGRDELVRAMAVVEIAPREATAREERGRTPGIALDRVRVTSAGGGRRVGEVSLEVAEGEIVGLTGLRGSGASELCSAISGASPGLEGAVRVAGREVRLGTPRDALRAGIAFVPPDRQRQSVILDLPVVANASLAALPRLSPRGVLSPSAERAALAPLLAPLGLSRVDLDAPLASLSGGTQQKVVLARALLAEPRVLLLDEPTRGVDLGAKAVIHAFVRDAAARGLTVIFATTDAEELFALADRIVVLSRGRITADLVRADASPEAVLRAAIGSEAA